MNYLQYFNYRITGQAQRGRLVFLHGLMGSGANWRKIVPAFSDEFEILTFDQRGHGRSFQPPVEDNQGYRPEDYSEDLQKILDELGWSEIFLVGHSMGGRNALYFASKFPHRVKKLVVEDIGPEANPEAVTNIQHLIGLVPTPFVSKKVARQFFLEKYASLIPQNPRAQVLAQYFYTNIEEKPDGTADWRFFKEGVLASVVQGRAKDRWQEWQDLTVPSLLIRGSESDELSREVYQRMLNLNDRVKGIEIPDSGHWVHFDQPHGFIESLTQFLQNSG